MDTPILTRQMVATLLVHAHDYSAGTAPPYGRDRSDIVAEADRSEWLEAVVLAGYVPYFEGIVLAVRATHLYWLDEAKRAQKAGVDGDALGWLNCDLYRGLVILLEGFVHEMEEAQAQIFDVPAPDATRSASEEEQQARRDEAAAAAARQRGLRALERRDSARRDQQS